MVTYLAGRSWIGSYVQLVVNGGTQVIGRVVTKLTGARNSNKIKRKWPVKITKKYVVAP
jgi:hypothetical protein